MRHILKRAFAASVPVMAGYIVLGIGFGIILRTKGYGVLWAFASSALILAGSMQFVMISLFESSASLLLTAISTLMVNGRHIFYSISMLDKYSKAGKAKPYLIFALTDETYSLVCADNANTVNLTQREKTLYWLFITMFDHFYWVAGSVLGSILGSVIKLDLKGIDFALTALFVSVVVEQWLSCKNHTSAIIGLGTSVIALLIFGPANFLIPAMIAITALLLGFRRHLDE